MKLKPYPIDKIVEQLEQSSTKEGAEWVRLQRQNDVKSVPEKVKMTTTAQEQAAI